MGMNLYLKRIPTDAEKRYMHTLIDSGRFDKLGNMLENATKELHLCKLSAGWKVKFDLNGGTFYEPTRQSIINFCKENHYNVVGDEYPMTIEEAFAMIDKHNADERNHYTDKEFFCEHPDQWESWFDDWNDEEWRSKGYNVEFCSFENDGLSFTTHADWR